MKFQSWMIYVFWALQVNIKTVFLMNQKVLVLNTQLAEKNSLKGKRLIHYPGLFKWGLTAQIASCCCLLGSVSSMTARLDLQIKKKSKKAFSDCQQVLHKILGNIGQSIGKNTLDMWVLERKFYKTQSHYRLNCYAWITG